MFIPRVFLPVHRLLLLSLISLAVTGGRVEAQERPAATPPAPQPPAPAAATSAEPAPAESAENTPSRGEPAPDPATTPATLPAPSADLFNPPDLDKALSVTTPHVPSQNVLINLITRLALRGGLTRGDAVELIEQAQMDVEVANRNAEALRAAQELPLAEESISVTYIPESVRAQMRDEIKQQVLAEVRNERFFTASGREGWPSRIELFGDVRFRYEFLGYGDSNDNTGAFPNFNAINTGAPFDTSGLLFSPQYNADTDRNRFRLRFRLGGDIDLDDGWKAGFRIATGENNSPITTNQSIGLANQGQGGNFSKYAIWLDRAFLKYEVETGPPGAPAAPEPVADPKGPAPAPPPPRRMYPQAGLTVWAGRFDNPFLSTDIIYDEDLGFDGLALRGRIQLSDSIKPFLTAGAFPIFNTDLNFSSNQPAKFSSTDKYLYAVQAGTDLKFNQKITAKLAGAYYHFDGVEGKLSSPYTPLNAQDAGDTDNTRPSFAQKGNTYRPLRNIIPDATNGFGTTNQFQYFGLATPFRDVALSGRVDFNHFEPVQISLIGEYIKNTAFDKSAINEIAVNNRGPVARLPDGTADPTGFGPFEGTDVAWILGVKVGHPALERRGAWNALLSYRYVGSDAVIDGFNDSEFGGGGTNVKGFTVGANVALTPRVSLGFTWMSADQIAGPPLKTDVFQFDIRAKF